MTDLTPEKRAELRELASVGGNLWSDSRVLSLLDALDAKDAELADWNLVKSEPVVIGRVAVIKMALARSADR